MSSRETICKQDVSVKCDNATRDRVWCWIGDGRLSFNPQYRPLDERPPAMTTIMLFAALLAQAENAELTDEDLQEINAQFVAAHKFDDNDFAYKEKIDEAVESGGKLKKRRVRLVAEVDYVTESMVKVNFFPEVDGRRQPVAVIRPIRDPNTEVEFARSNRRGVVPSGSSSAGSKSGNIEIGEMVPIELAKTLRQGDHIALIGEVREIVPVEVANTFLRSSFGRDLRHLDVAGIVIVVDEVKKISKELPKQPE